VNVHAVETITKTCQLMRNCWQWPCRNDVTTAVTGTAIVFLMYYV